MCARVQVHVLCVSACGVLSARACVRACAFLYQSTSYQVIKDVSLMDMDGHKGLKFRPLHLRQLLSRNIDQGVQQVQKLLIGGRHHFLI